MSFRFSRSIRPTLPVARNLDHRERLGNSTMAAPVADGFAANGSSACSHFIYATARPEGGFLALISTTGPMQDALRCAAESVS